MYGFARPQTGLKVVQLIIQETGTYNQQYRRAYNTVITGNLLNAFDEQVGRVQSISSEMVAGIAGAFVKPSATPESQIAIPNGWNEKRVRFMLEIQHTSDLHNVETEVILGYTDNLGLSGQHVDPQMKFYVNSTFRVRNTPMMTATGRQTNSAITDNSHVIVNNDWGSIYNSNFDQHLRPMDVFAAIRRSQLKDLDKDVADMRITSSSLPVKSKRLNNISSNYVAGVLQGYNSAKMSAGNNVTTSKDLYESARGEAKENLVAHDPFLTALQSVRGDGLGNVFTYNDLMTLDPDTDRICIISALTPPERLKLHQAGQTADWGATNADAQIATILSNSVSGMLMESGLTRLYLKATNQDQLGAVEIRVQDAAGFAKGVDIHQLSRCSNGTLQ